MLAGVAAEMFEGALMRLEDLAQPLMGNGQKKLRRQNPRVSFPCRPAGEALAPESQLACAAAASLAGNSRAAVLLLAARTSFSRCQASIVALTM